MYELFFWPTPNGKKVTILLEELGVPHKITPLNIGRGDQFAPDYLRIAPNNRMPALTDHAPKGGGAPISIFESAASMMYVAEKEGRFFPQDMRAKYDVVQWLMWQMGNQGPKFGEQGNFTRASQDPKNGDLTYGLNRFNNEVHRLFGVLNLGLHKKDWLTGEYSIADMCCYPWMAGWKTRNIDLDEFPNVKRWMEAIAARPAVAKAMAAGPEYQEDQSKLSDAEKARRAGILTNQRATPIPKEWA
ncbi:MAG: glutathione binding-like protein [Hyphomonadaceae bacterium]